MSEGRFESVHPPEPETNKIETRILEMKSSITKMSLPQVIHTLKEYVALRKLNKYTEKHPKDPNGLPDDVREFMRTNDLEGNDYLVNTSIDWMDKFEPWYDLQDTYKDWSPEELEELISGLEI